MIFKSRQVNLDPEPYVDQHGTTRSPDGDPAGHDFDVRFHYAPRPEFDATRDPLPNVLAFDTSVRLSDEDAYWAQARAIVRSPRPEFDTPVNRALVDFRNRHALNGTRDDAAEWLEVGIDPWHYSPEEVEHARRVLTRLTRFTTREEA